MDEIGKNEELLYIETHIEMNRAERDYYERSIKALEYSANVLEIFTNKAGTLEAKMKLKDLESRIQAHYNLYEIFNDRFNEYKTKYKNKQTEIIKKL